MKISNITKHIGKCVHYISHGDKGIAKIIKIDKALNSTQIWVYVSDCDTGEELILLPSEITHLVKSKLIKMIYNEK